MKAYPIYFKWDDDKYNGMDLRDYFAANACITLTELLSHPKDIARNAYKIADAMMEARVKE